MKLIIKEKYFPLIILIISLFVLFGRLWEAPVRTYDDSQYCAVAKNMILTGDYVHTRYTPTEPYFEKPPLVIWVTALGFKVFGISDFSARVFFAFFSLLFVFVFYYFIRKASSDLNAFLSSLFLITTQQFIVFSRRPMIDGLTGMLFALSLLFYYMGFKKREYFYIGGLFFGICFLARGFMPLFIPFCIGIYILISKEYRVLKSFSFYASWIVGFLIPIPWNLAMYNTFGDAFYKEHILTQYAKAFIGVKEGHVRVWNSPIEYIKKLLENYWPHLIFFCIGIYKSVKELKNSYSDEKVRRSITTLALSWFLGIFFLFHLSGIKAARYMTLIYPAMAIIASKGLSELKRKTLYLYLMLLVALIYVIGSISPVLFPKYLDGHRDMEYYYFLTNNKGKIAKLNKREYCYLGKKDWGVYFRGLYYADMDINLRYQGRDYDKIKKIDRVVMLLTLCSIPCNGPKDFRYFLYWANL